MYFDLEATSPASLPIQNACSPMFKPNCTHVRMLPGESSFCSQSAEIFVADVLFPQLQAGYCQVSACFLMQFGIN